MVGRPAVHRRRHHVLVRGHLPEQGSGPVAHPPSCRSTASPARSRRWTRRPSASSSPIRIPASWTSSAAARSSARRRTSGERLPWPVAPAHYLKQFLPKYADQAKIDQRRRRQASTAGSATSSSRSTGALNADLPVLGPWKTTSPINTPAWTLERNPFFYAVDTEGNQLPYLDKVQMTLAENLEVVNLRAIAGEYDEQERHIDLGKLPGLPGEPAEGQLQRPPRPRRQRLRTPPGRSTRASSADPEIAKWLRNKDFRHALCAGHRPRSAQRDVLARRRHARLGSCRTSPRRTTPVPSGGRSGPTLDVEQANELLDKIGLTKKDSEGYRAAHRQRPAPAHRDGRRSAARSCRSRRSAR